MKKEIIIRLNEALETKEQLRQAYVAANKDEGQQEAMTEWEKTLDDGSGDW